jgi:hypothetical protein
MCQYLFGTQLDLFDSDEAIGRVAIYLRMEMMMELN